MPPVQSPDLVEQRILITGASGFLGRHLVRTLKARGAEVHGISRQDRDGTDFIRWWRADIENLKELEGVWDAASPTIVYHMSGAVNGAPDLSLLLPTYNSLLTTTVNLLKLSTERRCHRLILIGSLEATDPLDGGVPPASPYAAAKSAATEYFRMCHALFETRAVMLRLFMSYGPGQPEWKLIPSTLKALFEGIAPSLSSGRRQLDWVYVDDVIEALVSAATARGIEGMDLDVGSGRLASIRDVVDSLVSLVNVDLRPRFGALPERPERPPRIADTTRTEQHLGWKASTTLDEGLRRTVEAFRQRR